MMEILEFLNMNSGFSIFIASISAIISAIAVGIALYFNAKTQYQYKKSLEPQLSMRLDKYNGLLYLQIQNTGRTAAQNIRMNIDSIENNGSNGLMLDSLFSQSYELYPTETIQAMVAISGENIGTGALYPKIKVEVSYFVYGTKTKVQYDRTITFSKVYDTKVFADVNMDLKEIESSLKSTARATVRAANYFDGNQVTIFDELNIISKNSLQNDLSLAAKPYKKRIVNNQATTLKKSYSRNYNRRFR